MFKTIIKTFETFCNSHLQIGEFDWGIMESVSAEERDFTMVWLMPTGVIQSQSMATFKFDMYVFDLVKQDKSNLLDVMNNCYMIGKDILGEFYDNEATYGFNIDETNGEPFDHQFDDYCGGWIFSIEVEAENTLNTCNIPMTNTIIPPERILIGDIIEYGESIIVANSESFIFRKPTTLYIYGSDNSDGTYISNDLSFVEGGPLGYIVTFEIEEDIPESTINLGNLYL